LGHCAAPSASASGAKRNSEINAINQRKRTRKHDDHMRSIHLSLAAAGFCHRQRGTRRRAPHRDWNGTLAAFAKSWRRKGTKYCA